MLEERGVPYRYREYTREPLSAGEIRAVIDKLGVEPRDLLRKRDPANRELGLTGDEAPEVLVDSMARHPTLLQRPIGLLRGKAILGRPAERLLELL